MAICFCQGCPVKRLMISFFEHAFGFNTASGKKLFINSGAGKVHIALKVVQVLMESTVDDILDVGVGKIRANLTE